MAKLTAKQQMFVREYLCDLNATQAAIRAGYSAKTAEQQGYRLLRNVQVADAIKEANESRSKKLSLSAEDVIQSILDIRSRAMVGEELNTALKANELLGRHLKLFTDKTEHSGAGGGPITIAVSFVDPADETE